jgi:hypothetical protein
MTLDADFEPTTQPQDALFSVSYGWTGGMGEAVFEPGSDALRRFKGLPVFVDSERIRDLVREKLPRSAGALRVRLAANITLKRKTERNPSIPGAPKQIFCEAVINRVESVRLFEEIREISGRVPPEALEAFFAHLGSRLDSRPGREEIGRIVTATQEMKPGEGMEFEIPVNVGDKRTSLLIAAHVTNDGSLRLRLHCEPEFVGTLREAASRP